MDPTKRYIFGERAKAEALCVASGGMLRLVSNNMILSGYRLYLDLGILVRRRNLFCTYISRDTEGRKNIRVAVVEREKEESPLMERCLKEMQMGGMVELHTKAGTAFTRSSVTEGCFEIEEDSYDDVAERIYSNYTLYCLGIYQLRLLTQRPSEAIFQKFLYTCKINSTKEEVSSDVLKLFAAMIQGILSMFGLLDYRLVDGLLCSMTISALNTFGARFNQAGVDPEAVIGESSNLLEKISFLITEFTKIMDKLHSIKRKASSRLDIALPPTFTKILSRIQRACGIPVTGILDAETLIEIDRAYDLLPKNRKPHNEDSTPEVGELILRYVIRHISVQNTFLPNTHPEMYVSYWKSAVGGDPAARKLKKPHNVEYYGSPLKQGITIKPVSRLVERIKSESKMHPKKHRSGRDAYKILANPNTDNSLEITNSTSSLASENVRQPRVSWASSHQDNKTSHASDLGHRHRRYAQPISEISNDTPRLGTPETASLHHQGSPSLGHRALTESLRMMNLSRRVSTLSDRDISSLQYGYPAWITLPRVNHTSRMLPLLTTSNIDIDTPNTSPLTPDRPQTASEPDLDYIAPLSHQHNSYLDAVEALQKLELLKTHSNILSSLTNAIKNESTIDCRKVIENEISDKTIVSLTDRVNTLSKKVQDLESDLQRSEFIFSMYRENVSDLKRKIRDFELRTTQTFSRISGRRHSYRYLIP